MKQEEIMLVLRLDIVESIDEMIIRDLFPFPILRV